MTAPSGVLEAAGRSESSGVGADSIGQPGVLREHLERGEGRPGGGGCQSGVVDERSSRVDEVLPDVGGREYRATLGRERLRQRRGDDDVFGARRTDRRNEPATARSQHTERVRFVEDEQRPDVGCQGDEVGDRGGVPEHRVQRLGDDHGTRAVPTAEELGDVVEVVVARHRDAAARERRHPSMRLAWACSSLTMRVPASARVVRTARLAEYPLLSTRAAGSAGEGGEGRLQLVVDVECAGDEARGPGPRAVGLGGGDRPRDDGRVGPQAEVVVAREVEPVTHLGGGEPTGEPGVVRASRLPRGSSPEGSSRHRSCHADRGTARWSRRDASGGGAGAVRRSGRLGRATEAGSEVHRPSAEGPEECPSPPCPPRWPSSSPGRTPRSSPC